MTNGNENYNKTSINSSKNCSVAGPPRASSQPHLFMFKQIKKADNVREIEKNEKPNTTCLSLEPS